MFLLIPIAGFVIAVGLTAAHRRRVVHAWTEVASQLELELDPGSIGRPPRLDGEVDGVPVRVDVWSGGSSKNRNQHTRYRVHHGPVGPPVSMRRQGSMSFLRRWVGGRDVEIGDPFFDDRVVIDTQHPDQVREFLTPARQAAVLEIFGSWYNAEFTHNKILVESKGIDTDVETVVGTIRRLVDTAATMGDPGELDVIMARRQAGDLKAAANELHQLNEHRSNVFTEGLEAEVYTELGDHKRASELFDAIEPRAGGDRVVQGWKSVASQPPPLPRGESEGRSGRVPDLDQQQVIDELFSAGLMSWEIVEHFERRYQNAEVTWSGELTTYRAYRHDHDFGDGPGLKATVLIGAAGRGDFISNEVHAVVQLGEGTKLERGTEVDFAGTLHHVDRFARKMWIIDASIV